MSRLLIAICLAITTINGLTICIVAIAYSLGGVAVACSAAVFVPLGIAGLLVVIDAAKRRAITP